MTNKENQLDKLFYNVKNNVDVTKKIGELLILLEGCGKLIPVILTKEQKENLSSVDISNSENLINSLVEKLKIISNELH